MFLWDVFVLFLKIKISYISFCFILLLCPFIILILGLQIFVVQWLIDKPIFFHVLNKAKSMVLIFMDGLLSRGHNLEHESLSFIHQFF